MSMLHLKLLSVKVLEYLIPLSNEDDYLYS